MATVENTQTQLEKVSVQFSTCLQNFNPIQGPPLNKRVRHNFCPPGAKEPVQVRGNVDIL